MELTYTLPKPALLTGKILSAFVILFMAFDIAMKFIQPEPVLQTTIHELGYKPHHILMHGWLALIPTILYLVPRTSILGAILLTAYFGGAIASHLRVDNPLFTHMLFPVYLAIFMWAGLWLRNERLRKIFPLTE